MQPDAETPHPPELDAAGCQRALALLVDIGSALALECKSPAQGVSLTDRARAFERVATAIRRCILLSEHIAEAAPARAAQRAKTEAETEARREQRRRQIIRSVEDTIHRRADPADAEALRLELLERIDQPEFDHDLATLEPERVIAELIRDLALVNIPGAPAHLRRTPDDIAVLCAQAAAPAGSGLPRWCAEALPQADRNDRAAERDERHEADQANQAALLASFRRDEAPRPHRRQ